MDTNTNACTSREQSMRIISLGISKTCADCCHSCDREEHGFSYFWNALILDGDWKSYWDVTDEEIPAWSLFRLLEIIDDECVIHLTNFTVTGRVYSTHNNLYDNIIDHIEYMVRCGYINKKYLS